jgi:hypothetical protein
MRSDMLWCERSGNANIRMLTSPPNLEEILVKKGELDLS